MLIFAETVFDMIHLIDSKKLIAEIDRRIAKTEELGELGRANELLMLETFITSLQQEQPENMIQWTGNNLKEVINFTGKSPRFGEWFKSWEELKNYVHTHNDILKLFCEDGSHYEVPVGAWIVKTPDGYNVPSVAKYIHQERPEVDLEKELDQWRHKHFKGKRDGDYSGEYLERESQLDLARHFYTLGLNARKEE